MVPGLLWRVSQARGDPASVHGETLPPVPSLAQAFWVTMSQDAQAKPCEALESSQEMEATVPS